MPINYSKLFSDQKSDKLGDTKTPTPVIPSIPKQYCRPFPDRINSYDTWTWFHFRILIQLRDILLDYLTENHFTVDLNYFQSPEFFDKFIQFIYSKSSGRISPSTSPCKELEYDYDQFKAAQKSIKDGTQVKKEVI